MKFIFCFLLALHKQAFGSFQGNIVGGEFAKISNFPHSVFVLVLCRTEMGTILSWSCGGSVLNQKIVLTAAHCLHECLQTSRIGCKVGTVNKKKGGSVAAVKRFLPHEKFYHKQVLNDICLLLMNNQIALGYNVKRVVVIAKPPLGELAQVAGWGKIDENKSPTDNLKSASQKVVNDKDCIKVLKSKPRHTICAQPGGKGGYVASGDSGSALTVRYYMQIGLVSYRDPAKSLSIGVYTYVPDYLDWIKKYSKLLVCNIKR